MRLRLVNTTAFRLSLIYALLFSLISTGAISFLYWNSAKEIRNQTDYQLRVEANALMDLYDNGKISALTREMNQLNIDGHSKFFLYALQTRDKLDFVEQIQPGVDLKEGVGKGKCNQGLAVTQRDMKPNTLSWLPIETEANAQLAVGKPQMVSIGEAPW